MIALQHQNCVWEQQIDQCSVPHQIPAVFRLIFEPRELLTGEGETVIAAEGLEVGHVAVQNRTERLPMQKTDVIALVKRINEDLPVHGLGDHTLVVEHPAIKSVRGEFGPEATKPRLDIEAG